MGDISGEKAAKSLRILSRSSATKRVGEKLYPIDMGKDTICGWGGGVLKLDRTKLVGTGSFPRGRGKAVGKALVVAGLCISEGSLERRSHRPDISVFAEHHRDHKPMIRRPNLAVAAMVAEKSCFFPMIHERGVPRHSRATALGEGIGLVREICARIKAERDRPMRVVSTGGLAPLFQQSEALFDAWEDDLTMHGLLVIHRYNKENS